MTETRQLTREALASLEQRLHALAMRAFTQHGWDAELYNGVKDCANDLSALLVHLEKSA